MEDSVPRPDTINNLRSAANGAFAMLAGMQLDVFTPLKAGSRTAEQIAAAIGVAPSRLRLLLYVLVTAGLLNEQDGRFSNTAEANHFLVKGLPSYLGNRHAAIAMRWSSYLKTAESIRSGVPQAKVDFANSPQEQLEAFLRSINANTVPAARTLIEKYDFSSVRTLVDVGSGGAGVAIMISKAFPNIVATAIDLPQVAPIAQKIVAGFVDVERANFLLDDGSGLMTARKRI
jgi:2-hydroxy-4-(methylsulfanyl)butanoate S-methyltransferase